MKEVFVGLDIGGTKLIAAAADEQGRIIKQERASTPRALDEGLDLLDRMIAAVTDGAAVGGMERRREGHWTGRRGWCRHCTSRNGRMCR